MIKNRGTAKGRHMDILMSLTCCDMWLRRRVGPGVQGESLVCIGGFFLSQKKQKHPTESYTKDFCPKAEFPK
eukprot:1239924-Amphidinium_carterae.1